MRTKDVIKIVLIITAVYITTSDAIENVTQEAKTTAVTIANKLENNDTSVKTPILKADTRRNKRGRNKSRSTSSSSESVDEKSSKEAKEELGLSSSSESTSGGAKRGRPAESEERKGWRKWHRKCNPCPEQRKKWRDPTLPWICGAYQRARRSFKSLCMMHYRNCQDGTMFVKIYDHRCKNDTYHGEHFFYDYHVTLSDENSDSASSGSSSSGTVNTDTTVSEEDEEDMFKQKKKKRPHNFLKSE